ncbi:MAG: hypothetical protein CMP59_01595 [Flavobacteriales bacterium]|nr:hypothetical protein [Flavobacteriales bacterium]
MNFPLKRRSCLNKCLFGISLLWLVISFTACGPARHLEGDQRLLKRTKISQKKQAKFHDELFSLTKQKPNRKLLGLFKVYLGVYNLYYHKEDSKIKEKIGEPPVVFDSTLHKESAKRMETYLNNRGYYDNEVDFEAKITKKNAIAKYKVDKGERYSIESLDYIIPNERMRELYFADSNKAVLAVGKPFDLERLKEERSRIEKIMKNKGYYEFSREFVVFQADTFMNRKSSRLKLNIKNKQEELGASDSLIESPHEIFSISKVYVRMDFDERGMVNVPIDTTEVDGLIFTESGEPQFRYEVVARSIFIRPGQLYELKRQEDSYRNLTSLGVFSYVSIKYEQDYSKAGPYLVVYIDLNPRKQKAYTILTEGTNNGGNLGINADLTFLNRNTFRGAELLNVTLSGGIEAQQLLTNQGDERIAGEVLPFNTLEFGPEVSLRVPRFLLPIDMDKFSPRGSPSTTFGISYNFQRRPDFRRNVTKTYISYSWNETPAKTHIITPFDLSYINLDPSPEFEELLEDVNDPFLRNSYTDNLILAFRYSYILNTQLDDKFGNHDFFFRGNIEPAGNLLSLVTNENNLEKNDEGAALIAGTPYAQYVRGDFDFRYYRKFFYNTVVYRFAAGLGIPYGNSSALPFEKSFFAGGANGIRAWLARDLGPGTLNDSIQSNVDQIGNLSLEANVELRFPITDIFEGAAFVDMGNIWNYKQDNSREETQFKLGTAWDGTAIGLGAGLRLNFTFFILRFDFAAPFKDPGKNNPNLLKLYWNETNLNFGIGYPF